MKFLLMAMVGVDLFARGIGTSGHAGGLGGLYLAIFIAGILLVVKVIEVLVSKFKFKTKEYLAVNGLVVAVCIGSTIFIILTSIYIYKIY